MEIENTSVTFQDEEVVKQNFWMPLCLSINIHLTMAAFVGLL
jgi:hypothetical protein